MSFPTNIMSPLLFRGVHFLLSLKGSVIAEKDQMIPTKIFLGCKHLSATNNKFSLQHNVVTSLHQNKITLKKH